MVERESRRGVDKLKELLRELARSNAKLEELAVANLNYLRPRVRRWLKEGIEFDLDEVLTKEEERMVRFYSGLDGVGKPLGLEKTALHLGRSPKSKDLIAAALRYCWIKLKKRELFGSEAIETLKLPGLIYSRLVQMEVVEIIDIPKLSIDQVRGACGNEWGLAILKEAMQKKDIDWQPEVEFPLITSKKKGY